MARGLRYEKEALNQASTTYGSGDGEGVDEMTDLDRRAEAAIRELGIAFPSAYSSEMVRMFKAGAMEALRMAEEWCGVNAYDSDKGACDEHTVDESRGNVCSADELLRYLMAKLEGK